MIETTNYPLYIDNEYRIFKLYKFLCTLRKINDSLVNQNQGENGRSLEFFNADD